MQRTSRYFPMNVGLAFESLAEAASNVRGRIRLSRVERWNTAMAPICLPVSAIEMR